LSVLLATASASLTEVRQDFLNQTATFSSTSVMTAPTADGSYLVTVYLDQSAGGTVSATIGWTDENGNQQTFPVLGGSACFAVRLKANTSLTVSTTGDRQWQLQPFCHWRGLLELGAGHEMETPARHHNASGRTAERDRTPYRHRKGLC
jgi:hypothetical protein